MDNALTLVILFTVGVISLIVPVFADHSYLGWTIEHTSTTFEDFEIDYRNYGAIIKKIHADISDKKLLLDVRITATPAFLEIDLARNLLDARDKESVGDFTIIYDGNRAGFDEIETSLKHRTLNIQLRGVSTSEHIKIEIIGTHIFEEISESEPKPKSEPKEKIKSEKNIDSKKDIDKKTNDIPKPIKDQESLQMIGPVQMIEFLKIMTPEQKIPFTHKILLKESLQLNVERESKPDIKSKLVSPTITSSQKFEHIVEEKIENDTIKEDSCFICKNKKKLENSKPQFEQLQEPVIKPQEKIETKSKGNFLNEIFSHLRVFFNQLFS